MQIHRPQNAFTLVELMVVIVIIGITTSIIVAEMGGTLEDALLRSNARTLVDVCDAASNRAVASGQAQVLRIDQKTGRFSVEARPTSADEELPAPTASGSLDTRVELDIRDLQPEGESDPEDDASEAPAPETLTFRADGTTDAREFLLRDRAGGELLLRINPATSRVRIVELGSP